VYNIVRISSKDTVENNRIDHIQSEGHPILGESDKLIDAVYSVLPVSDTDSLSSSEIKVYSFCSCFIIIFYDVKISLI
jgi:hypothetical protein